MNKIVEELSKPLSLDEVELRVGTINTSGYCEVLIYKTARADVSRLNLVCGSGWKNRHFFDENKGLCCGISVYDPDIKEWVERVDIGSESNMEKEKGGYSDSFKRAGFRWGIGLELYKMPKINIKLAEDEYKIEKDKNGYDRAKATWKLKVNEWSIDYKVVNGIPCDVIIKDESGGLRYPKTLPKTQTKPKEQPKEEPKAKSVLDENIEAAMKVAGMDNIKLLEMVKKNFAKKWKDLTTTEKQSLVILIKQEAEKPAEEAKNEVQ
jgi:hypothetical protein